ncbi:DUF6969 family protein [Sinorhizobium meliloti]|uniref:DUF6969 family protein n=1 Tax=Rhizobium meliloti TaxID=382 RepID=UPI003AF31B13
MAPRERPAPRRHPSSRFLRCAAVGVDAHGRLLRLFTVNQWVVGDDRLGTEGTIALLPRFDVQMPRPSNLVNRWLTAIFTAYEREISELIRERDRALLTHRQPEGVEARQDRALEVTSELEPSDCRCSRPLRPKRGGGISAVPGH